MIRVFEAFAGYGSQSLALERLKRDYPDFEYEVVGISEIDKYAIQAYNALHPGITIYGDISKIDWNKVPDFDLLTYSFPCFVAGTYILTTNGYKEIQDVVLGDRVLTHLNRYCEVEKVGCKPCDTLYRVRGMMFDNIDCTPEHPFYVRKRFHKWDNINRRSERLFEEPKWKDAKDLTKDDYLGYAINTDSKIPEWNGSIDNRWGHNRKVNKLQSYLSQSAFWYLMGRYVGDGWKKNSNSGKGVVICCSERNEKSLVSVLDSLNLHYTKAIERTVIKYIISMNELCSFVDRYGYYAHSKRIDIETLSLPKELLRSFIEGVIDSDGCYTNNEYKITSVSRELIYGLQQCIAKAYTCPVRIYKAVRKKTTIIEGREVNQRDTYSLVWHPNKRKQDKAFYDNGYVWFPIKSVEKLDTTAIVYNMQVNGDHSYTANGAIVHNCTDISNAGQQKGFEEGSGTRSSLLWECRKAIIAKKPKYLLMENVKALVSKKFFPMLKNWIRELQEYGYTNFMQVLNAKDYGVPQNRERVFMVSILDENAKYEFPEPFPLEKRLKDVLEDEVDEKYYLSDKMIECFENRTQIAKEKGNGFRFAPTDGGGMRKQ